MFSQNAIFASPIPTEERNHDSDQGEEEDHNDGDSTSFEDEEHKEDPYGKEWHTNLTAMTLIAIPFLTPGHLNKSQQEVIALSEPELNLPTHYEPELNLPTNLVIGSRAHDPCNQGDSLSRQSHRPWNCPIRRERTRTLPPYRWVPLLDLPPRTSANPALPQLTPGFLVKGRW